MAHGKASPRVCDATRGNGVAQRSLTHPFAPANTPGAVRGWDKMVGGNGSAHCPMDPTLDGGEPNQYIITVQPAHTLRAEGSDGLS